jgi:hypothetical protein
MFDYVLGRYKTQANHPVLKFENRAFETAFASYEINNDDGIPILYCIPKYEYPYDFITKL